MTVNLYAPPPDIVVASWPQVGRTAVEGYDIESNIQDPAYELRRIPLPGTSVNKGEKRKGRGCLEQGPLAYPMYNFYEGGSCPAEGVPLGCSPGEGIAPICCIMPKAS